MKPGLLDLQMRPRRRPRRPLIWVTRDGRRYTIDEMSGDHVRAALAMLRKAGYCSVAEFKDSWAGLGCLQGEMALYYAEGAVSNMRPHRFIDAFEQSLRERIPEKKHDHPRH